MRKIYLLDSVTEGGPAQAGQIVITGSHGGRSAAGYALSYRPFLVVFNDAGVGKDRAGVVGLDLLEAAGIAAVAVAHTSARIGEAKSTYEEGVISHANAPARALGLEPGQKLCRAIRSLRFPERR